ILSLILSLSLSPSLRLSVSVSVPVPVSVSVSVPASAPPENGPPAANPAAGARVTLGCLAFWAVVDCVGRKSAHGNQTVARKHTFRPQRKGARRYEALEVDLEERRSPRRDRDAPGARVRGGLARGKLGSRVVAGSARPGHLTRAGCRAPVPARGHLFAPGPSPEGPRGRRDARSAAPPRPALPQQPRL